MTFEDLQQLHRLGDTNVSPDGRWVLYSVTDVDLEKNTRIAELWLQQLAGGEPKRLDAAQAGDSGGHFSPDGRQVLFLSSRDGGQQIYTADFDSASGATTEAKKQTNLSTEADGAIWAPDGNSIVFTSSVYPDCAAISGPVFSEDSEGERCNHDRDAARSESKVKAQIFTHLLYRHWNAYTGDKRSHLFLLTLTDGTTPGSIRDLNPNDSHSVPPFSLGGSIAYAISPDSKELAFTENLDEEPAISTNADIFTLDLTNPTAKPVKISTASGGDFSPAYSPDSRYIGWRSEARASYESDRFRLVVYTRSTKKIREVMPHFENWVDEFAWSSDSKRIYFLSGTAGESPLFVTTLDGEWKQLRGDAEYGSLVSLGDGRTLVATKMTVRQPGEVVVVLPDEQGSPERAVTHLNDALLARLELPAMENYWFTAADKTKVEGFVIRPPAFDESKKYPVKFLIHGGPQGAWGDAWSYRWNPELFAANGYVVIMVNPRGSTGYGQAFVDGVNGDWGGRPFSDLMLGLDAAEKQFSFIDKNRECALGASYGGFMANWILGHSNRFRCIVSHDGMFNPESAYGSTEELWFNEWEFKGHPWDYHGKPDSENPFRKWSPMLSAKNFKTPTLVIHGQLDYRLDLSEGLQLFTTLQRLKVPSKMLYFPDEGHWVVKPQNSRLWYKTVNDWVDQWTAPGIVQETVSRSRQVKQESGGR